jgi:hypothetical protein
MENTSGFYKLEDGNWQYAPNAIYAPNYTLEKELKDTYTYPVDGWTWYDEQPYINNNN